MRSLGTTGSPYGLRPKPWIARLSLVLVVTLACASGLAGSTHGRVVSGSSAAERANGRKSACPVLGRRSPNRRRERLASKDTKPHDRRAPSSTALPSQRHVFRTCPDPHLLAQDRKSVV